MLTSKEIEALEAAGFKRWTKGDYDRLYFNVDSVMDIDRYKTGNLRSVRVNGEKISNSKASFVFTPWVAFTVSKISLL